jgi:hypothetical protein
MTTLRCPHLGRCLSLVLCGLLVLTALLPPGTIITKRADAQGARKVVLAFPATDESEQKNLGEVAARLTSALALAGREAHGTDLDVFSATSPVVRRALADGTLRSIEVEAAKDAATALTIGRALRVDSVVLVGVQSLKIAGEPRAAELAVVGTEYNVAANLDKETGALASEPKGTTFGVSGSRGRAQGDDAELIRAAARDAAFKITHVLSGGTAEEYVERGGAQPQKKSNMWQWVAIGLVVVGVIAATTIKGKRKNVGPAATDLIPTRRTVRATANGVQLSWAPPATTEKTIFKYQIERSDNGLDFVRIDNEQVGPTATSFTDFNVISGHAYVYQIRVLYTDGKASEWVQFDQVQAI